MRIWIDLANSPHVLFFAPLIEELRLREHQVVLTARDFAQTLGLLRLYGLEHETIGKHAGRGRFRKIRNIFGRGLALRRWAKQQQRFDLAISHNSYAHIIAARLLRVPSATLMDYEYQPANHLAFRLARRVIVPFTFSDEVLRKYGARPSKVRRYQGLKEQVYLCGFEPDPAYPDVIQTLLGPSGYDPGKHLLYVVRPPATMSAYHDFENPLFLSLLRHLRERPEIRTILLPRTAKQKAELSPELGDNIVIPEQPLEGRNTIWHADAVISAGGTMCREAAAFGTPAYTIFWGKMGSVDEHLISEGRLIQLAREEDFAAFPTERIESRRKIGPEVRDEVIELCLATAKGN